MAQTKKTNLNAIVQLKRSGYAQKDIASKMNITQGNVSYLLRVAKERGLWNGEEGLNPEEDLSYEDYLEKARNSDMVGRPLTREEWNALWKDEKTLRLKGSPSYYKCPQCMTKLFAIDDIEFEPAQIRDLLKQNGITHFCKTCLTGYRRLDRSVLGEGRCFQCGNALVEIFSEGESVGFYCKNCQLLYSKDELEKEGFIEEVGN